MTEAGREVTVETWQSLHDLTAEWDPLFEAGPDVQSGRAWFAASIEAALPEGRRALFFAARVDGRPAALLPMQAGPGRALRSLTTPYTCLYQPLFRPDARPEQIPRLAAALGDHIRRWPVAVLEAMDAEWPGLAPFRAGLRRAGLVTRTFAHFGNWHEPVPGSWTAYLEGRPGELRATISRKTRSAGRDPALRLEMVQAPEQLPEALAAYEAVYARSWKQKEPYPAFNRALVARLAASGALRFGLMWAGDQPIAAQYWTVWQGRGTVLKLAHDDKFRPVSPGTVLTAHAIRYLIETDRVTRLDFGRGDDPYKRGWARHRRQRIGLVVFNPSMFRGAAELIRHEGGKFLRSARLFLRHRRAEQDIRPAAHGDVP